MANETAATGAVSVGGDAAKIVLEPHQGSHPFVQREVVLREAQKVGRSVDRKRISPNNLIFDCRVLSRNHALIWFENGKVSMSMASSTELLDVGYYLHSQGLKRFLSFEKCIHLHNLLFCSTIEASLCVNEPID